MVLGAWREFVKLTGFTLEQLARSRAKDKAVKIDLNMTGLIFKAMQKYNKKRGKHRFSPNDWIMNKGNYQRCAGKYFEEWIPENSCGPYA